MDKINETVKNQDKQKEVFNSHKMFNWHQQLTNWYGEAMKYHMIHFYSFL